MCVRWLFFSCYTSCGCSVFHSDACNGPYMAGSSRGCAELAAFSSVWSHNAPNSWFGPVHAGDIAVNDCQMMKNVSLAFSSRWRGNLCLPECVLTLSESLALLMSESAGVCLCLPAACLRSMSAYEGHI